MKYTYSISTGIRTHKRNTYIFTILYLFFATAPTSNPSILEKIQMNWAVVFEEYRLCKSSRGSFENFIVYIILFYFSHILFSEVGGAIVSTSVPSVQWMCVRYVGRNSRLLLFIAFLCICATRLTFQTADMLNCTIRLSARIAYNRSNTYLRKCYIKNNNNPNSRNSRNYNTICCFSNTLSIINANNNNNTVINFEDKR